MTDEQLRKLAEAVAKVVADEVVEAVKFGRKKTGMVRWEDRGQRLKVTVERKNDQVSYSVTQEMCSAVRVLLTGTFEDY